MSEPIRVLHIAKSLGLGGTEKVMQLFATHLSRRWEAVVYSPRDGERGEMLRAAGVATHIQPDLFQVLQRVRPRLVHVHRAGWPEPELMRPLRNYGAPVVETNVFGRFDPSPSGRAVTRHLFVSHFCARRFAALHGVPVEPPAYGVLYNPVDTDFFAQALPAGPDFAQALPAGPDFAQALPAGPDFSRPVVGRVSRADKGKWSPLALDFLPHALRAAPNLEYRIIGGIPEAEAWVDRNGLSGRVRFLPPVRTDAELAAFYGGCSVLAHANDTGESFGLVIAEAMACGLPVVTHPCPPPRDNAQVELVDNEVTGFVAENAEEYGLAVARLLGDPALARRMGEAGRQKAARLYRAQTVTLQLEAIYDEILANQAKGKTP
ncbi:glycosyltransferase family 4 protein [Paucidesulfovibrio longus]|uniref:glycosyltransferase family 4 protein n=1 Tax=Paucidesulfovibrio longus TaxID=889 RepID=UPI0003B5A2E7|nr:glycosyltransferase family 4 protein [Paucidesulfovibrio longus]